MRHHTLRAPHAHGGTVATRHTAHHTARLATLAAALATIAALSACGGGDADDDSGNNSSGSMSLDTAGRYAAHATLASADGGTAVDVAVKTAQAVVAAHTSSAAATAAGTRSTASAKPSATGIAPSVTIACAGGGTATVSATGPTLAGLYNGALDPGEVYQLSFTNCQGSTGAAVVNGALAVSVPEVGTGSLNLDLTATALSVALTGGRITIDGSLSYSAIDAMPEGAAYDLLRNSDLRSSQLTLTTQRNSRTQTFTVTALAVQRSSTWSAGLPLSSSMQGSSTFTAALGDASYSATLTTSGSTAYGADGLPTSGSWALTLPNTQIGLAVSGEWATLTVDDGHNGSIDRSLTVPRATLAAAAN